MKRIFVVLAVIAALSAGAYGGMVWFLTRPAPTMVEGPVISLSQGQVMAGIDRADPGVLVFNGLPFAAAPVGDLRWRAPQAAPVWQGVRDGRAFGAECIQSRAGSAEFYADIVKGLGLGWVTRQLAAISIQHAPPPVESEDCLFLNVRTANLDGPAAQPVMVWLHGGSHQTGSGSTDVYQANGLVRHGVVLVTINYRLGPLGYLAHPALSADDPRGVSGNYGLLDQVAALQWVTDNIAAFGGDPSNVTLFGESAGAQSVTEVMSTQLSAGLFHKAILQSGASSYNANGLERSIEGRMSQHAAGVEFFTGLAGETASAADLRAVPAASLVTQIEAKGELVGYMRPGVDGVVIKRLIGETIRERSSGQVPILAGYNADEATLFFKDIQSPTVLKSPFPAEHADRMAMLDALYGAPDAAVLRAEYRLDDPATYQAGATAMLGDDMFGVHMRFLAKANVAAGQPTWLYFFARTPPNPKQTLGAFHASELFFVFDSHSPFLPLSEDDRALTRAMGQYWTNFAKTGNPNGEGLPGWPPYDGMTDQWMTFTPLLKATSGLRAARLNVLERALDNRIDLAAPLINPPRATALAQSGDQQAGADRFEP